MNLSGTVIQLTVLVAVILSPVYADEIYRWTDADGNTHITDRPPEDGSSINSVIRYSNRPESPEPPAPAAQPIQPERQHAERLKKQLERLREREMQLEKIIDENQASIAAAEEEAAYYRRRSGSYARRNKKAIERQLLVLNNNLTTYQSDLLYIKEDIAEAKELLKAIKLN